MDRNNVLAAMAAIDGDRSAVSSTAYACVEALYVYPVKSCAGVRVSDLRFDADGRIVGDREWIVVDARGELAWLGSHPKLARVQPKLLADALLLCAQGQQPVRLSRAAEGEVTHALIWNAEERRLVIHPGRDAGAVAAQFLREVTGEDLRLVKLERSSALATAPNALHAVSTGSVVELNEMLAAHGRARVDVRRLRPNLVLRGMQEALVPFIEEHLMQLVWRDGEGWWRRMTHAAACERCVVPNVDPDSGEAQSGIDTAIAELSAQRWPGHASRFGVYLSPPAGSSLSEGTVMTMELDF
ncbi:MOSC N-terminal beta barrel domain-containing protein [Mitsuaria sp. 7]|uniref:MOSC N-terminal beta barrel domain-containing protein n=1 Tax=Mitsuaria sp. 7 TaxID=1658665 RepID=UPI0008373C87|nr:MOSC N-terminal beta barrel domain-containing protein [Mitsuaria sp. 7]